MRHLILLLILFAVPAAAGAAGNDTPAPQATATEAVRFTGRALEGDDG